MQPVRNDLAEWYLRPHSMPALSSRKGFYLSNSSRHYFEYDWAQGYIERVHVNSHRRVVFCAIPKVGLTQFLWMMYSLQNANESMTSNPKPKRFGLKGGSLVGTSFLSRHLAGFMHWKSPSWKFAVFVRDPLERFLSAFLDKCLGQIPNLLCPVKHQYAWIDRVLSTSRLEDQVVTFEAFVSAGIPTPAMHENDHWILQSAYIQYGCQFVWQRIHFLGLLSSDREAVNWQVREMLHSSFGLSLHRAAQVADKYFPLAGPKNRDWSAQHNKAAGAKMHQFYRNREILAQVLRYVGRDYDSLGLSMPSWVQAAMSNKTEPSR